MTLLPSPDAAFADLPSAAATDCAELGRIPQRAVEAAARLDPLALDALASRLDTIAARHPHHARVQELVRRARHTLGFQRRKVGRQLGAGRW